MLSKDGAEIKRDINNHPRRRPSCPSLVCCCCCILFLFALLPLSGRSVDHLGCERTVSGAISLGIKDGGSIDRGVNGGRTRMGNGGEGGMTWDVLSSTIEDTCALGRLPREQQQEH